MSGKRNILVTFGFVLSASLIAAAVSALFASCRCSRLQFELLNTVCGEVVEQEPEAKKIISAALKEYLGGNPDGVAEDDILSALGSVMCFQIRWDSCVKGNGNLRGICQLA